MPRKDDAGPDLARKIIELSDLIGEHSRKLTRMGFVPTREYVEETQRLTKMCRELANEADTIHSEHQED